MKFTIKFSCSIWIIESLSKDRNIGNHKYGQQIACIILSVFALSNFYIRKIINNNRKNWKNSKTKRIIYEILFLLLTIMAIVSSIVCIKSNNVIMIGLTVIICSLLISNLQTFLQFDEPSINRFHPEFQMCQTAVYNISHYTTLLGIPILINFFTS
jgi:asparagine N-glycosylation enzyme membrane subunit Stt3